MELLTVSNAKANTTQKELTKLQAVIDKK